MANDVQGSDGRSRKCVLYFFCAKSSFSLDSQGVDRDEYERHVARVDKYGLSGLSHGQSAACTIYILANVLERVDNDILW